MSKTVLITGATSGIGLELARLFAKDNYDLVLTARNVNKLKEVSEEFVATYKIKVKIIIKDLSKNNSAQEVYDEITLEKIKVDILINNAGIGRYGDFAASEMEIILDMMQLNITSLAVLTKLFLKEMLERDSGRIMNVASTAGFQPGPFMALYFASKAFVLSFSEAVAEEINDTNVSLSTLCPGPTKTGFQERAGINKKKLEKRKLAGMMSAEKVARIGYKGLMKGRRIIIPGKINWLLSQTIRFTPRRFVTKIIKYINKG